MSLHDTLADGAVVGTLTAATPPPPPPGPPPMARALRESAAAYHARPDLSRSVLDRLAKSPAHLRHHVDEGDDKDTDAKQFGRAYHALALEETTEGELVVAYDGKRDKRCKEWIDFQAEHAGKEILKATGEHGLDKAKAMVARLKREQVWQDLEGAARELTLLFTRDGITCKARVDAIDVARRTIWDLKTADNAAPDSFFRTAFFDLGLHRQADWYLEAASQVFGVKFERFVFVVQEKKGSFEFGEYVAFADSDWVARGRAENDANLEMYRACRKTATWPGYGRRHIMLPRGVLS